MKVKAIQILSAFFLLTAVSEVHSMEKCRWRLQILLGKTVAHVMSDFGQPGLSDWEAIQKVVSLYPDLLKLTGKVDATPEGVGAIINASISPSKQMFGEVHTEFDRTVVGILTLKWVLEGNYDQFTSVQKAELKLTRAAFEQLRQFTRSNIKDPEDLDAMITYMVINDLGKVKSIVADLKTRFKIEDPDHDVILLQALRLDPSISEAFLRLSESGKKKVLAGLESRFNLGQFIQGENVAGSLTFLKALDEDEFNFHLIHAIYDIAGAAGHVNPSGSVVMTESTYAGISLGLDKLSLLRKGASPKEVYLNFMAARAKQLSLSVENPHWLVDIRLNLLFRSAGPQDTVLVREVFERLPPNARAILNQELSTLGTDDGYATLVYYAPALIANLRRVIKDAGEPDSDRKALEKGLITLARIYQEARVILKKQKGDGVFTVNINSIAEAVGKTPKGKMPDILDQHSIKLTAVGLGSEAKLVEKAIIEASAFSHLSKLSDLPGKKVAVVGIGGGSDGIQAAMLGQLLESNGKDVSCVVSVRTSTTGSQGGKTAIGSPREVYNHGGFVGGDRGVMRITTATTGEGRFVENIPAGDKKVYLVLDPDEITDPVERNRVLQSRIQMALGDAGETDSIFAVDTGGDALYGSVSIDGAKATPDQDLRVLRALQGLTGKYQIKSVEIAAGVDSPANAKDVLRNAGAMYYNPTPEEADRILKQYIAWRMDGTDEERYGKTPLAWQAALRSEFGMQVLPLPTRVVIDPKNPWITIFRIDPSMRGILFMDIDQHLHAISVAP
jgi:hypothetical protein